MRKIRIAAALLLFALTVACAACALAAESIPESKTLEESTSYEGDGIRVDIDRWLYAYKKFDLRFYVVNVFVDGPAQLQTAFAGDEYSKHHQEAVSAIAARHDAFLAINGDYYNYRDDEGLVIRGGVLYRDKKTSRDQLLIHADGTFEAIVKGSFEPGHGQEYLDSGVLECLTFGPLLVEGGEAVTFPKSYALSLNEEIREPRTVIGWVEENHYMLLVADGRRNGWSDKGMTLRELQQVLVEQGCQIAYNLDGGGSTTLYVNGEIINRPSGSRERDVSDIIMFVQNP